MRVGNESSLHQTASFTARLVTAAHVKRHIPLNGSKNFRDFGGYPTLDGRVVKRGALYRADSLSFLDDDDLTKLEMLGIRTVCDLRRQQEKESYPSKWYGNETRFWHLPLFLENSPSSTGGIMAEARKINSEAGSRQIMINIYRRMVSDPQALQSIYQVFDLASQMESSPLLIHCSGGKDRTGICCALLLTLINVDQQHVMEDYMESLHLYTQRLERNAPRQPQVYEVGNMELVEQEVLRPIYAVDPSYLNSAFEYITDNYGTAESFFRRALRLSEQQIHTIRNNYIE